MSSTHSRSTTQPSRRVGPPLTSRNALRSSRPTDNARGSNKGRALVWTIGVAAITAMGTWYGAGLKITGEAQEERQKRASASSEERLAQLEATRSRLTYARSDLEKKIQQIERRRDEKEASNVG